MRIFYVKYLPLQNLSLENMILLMLASCRKSEHALQTKGEGFLTYLLFKLFLLILS